LRDMPMRIPRSGDSAATGDTPGCDLSSVFGVSIELPRSSHPDNGIVVARFYSERPEQSLERIADTTRAASGGPRSSASPIVTSQELTETRRRAGEWCAAGDP